MKQDIPTKEDLITYMESGFRTKNNYKVGIEFEVFLYNKSNYQPVEYQGNIPNIQDLLKSYNPEFWQTEYDNNYLVGLHSKIGNITLEPAGQLEFSSIPFTNVKDIAVANTKFFKETLSILKKQNIGMYPLGLNPKHQLDELPLMPKARYNFMDKYMSQVGSMGKNMMRQTCTVQTNLDYSSNSDLAKKFRVGMALAPIISAMYANSPLHNGKNTNYLSYRNKIWQNTDPSRAGFLQSAFTDGFTLEKYVDYALNVPMYFLYRNKEYIKIPHITFGEYLSGNKKIANFTPNLADFITHLSTLFPHVRLKTYMEIRYPDCVDTPYLESLPALFVGLLYHDASLENIYNLVKNWSFQEVVKLQNEVIKHGLAVKFKGSTVQNIALQILNIAEMGLKARGLQEEVYLYPLIELIKSGKTLAEEKLNLLASCGNNINKFIDEISINEVKSLYINKK